MNLLRSLFSRLKQQLPASRIDLATFNPLGRAAADGRTREEERAAAAIIEQVTAAVAENDRAYHRHREKYAAITAADAEAVLAAFPAVDFGECASLLSSAEQAFLTEEKHTLIIPLLEQLAQVRTCGQEGRISPPEFIELKRLLLGALLRLFSSPAQIPTFDWTIGQLLEMEMIPAHFTLSEMEQYCPLGRWG